MVDRADAPMFVNKVALYGHSNIYDITDESKEPVVEKIFAHLIVGHAVDQSRFYSNFQFNSPTNTVPGFD